MTGARFYKAPLNTGTHVAALWTSTGTALATATFTGESASGWQQVLFPSPVAIAANTTYVISYLAPNGHYPGQDGYFASAGVDNPPLHALRNGVDGPNGLYRYSSSSVFPTDTFQSEGYFVDVVFSTTTGPDVTAPSVKSVNPIAGASGISATTNVLVTFTEAMDQSTITSANVFLRTPAEHGRAGDRHVYGGHQYCDHRPVVVARVLDAATRGSSGRLWRTRRATP